MNQLHTAAQRALEGCGFPFGADAEGAAMVVALECIGLHGAQRLLAQLPLLARAGFVADMHWHDVPQSPPGNAGSGSVGAGDAEAGDARRADANARHFFSDAGSAGGLALAPLVVDWCRQQCAAHGVGVAKVCGSRAQGDVDFHVATDAHATDSDGAWYLATVLAAPLGWFWEVRWNEGGCGYLGRRTAHGDVLLFHARDYRAWKPTEVTCYLSAPPSLPCGDATLLHSAAECNARHLRCQYEGVDIAEEVWQVLKRYAARVLVPASRDSITHGAGGGDAND